MSSTELLERYTQELWRWNKKINLVSKAILSADFIEYHLKDSELGCAEVARDILSSNEFNEIWDLGSGNGLPGMVFAILYPNIRVVAVDIDQRKSAFLKATAITLGISNFNVKNIDIRIIEPGKRVYLARGLADISKSHELVSKVSEPGSVFYHFKSTHWRNELENSSTWNISEISRYKLGRNQEVENVIVKAVRS